MRSMPPLQLLLTPFAVYREPVNSGQPLWTRPQRGSRGPVPTYSRDEIVATAVAVADADGLAAVSMRAVAAALGTRAGSLYRYLSSRDDLLDLMTDRVVGELRPYPDTGGPWLDTMLVLGRRQLELFERHRWLIGVVHRPSGMGPQTLAWFDNCLRVLQPVHCGVAAKFEAIAMTTGVAALFGRSEAAAPATAFAGVDVVAHPYLTAALAQPPAPAPPQDLFERTLRSVLTGLLGDA
jgi:AcrR family transcriptional regulator